MLLLVKTALLLANRYFSPTAACHYRTHKGYEEVAVPAVQGLPAPTADELVPIASLEPWAQAAFPGYKSLNRIQSRIFTTAYYR